MHWQTARFDIDLSVPRVMGIVNATPDSFSDGGRSPAEAIAQCERLAAEGADILDIGGESTRPGSEPPDVDTELRRVLPVVREAVRLGLPISIDTSRAAVMRACLDLGADIVNDVRALRQPGAMDVLAAHPRAGVCLMHLLGEPRTMQLDPAYDDVVDEVARFLAERATAARAAGIAQARIVIDPGIGFGKSLVHNLELSRRQRELLALGYPLLLGWSRKGTLGRLTGREVGSRGAASVAAVLASVVQGASIVRVHDVAATVDALKVWRALTLEPSASASTIPTVNEDSDR